MTELPKSTQLLLESAEHWLENWANGEEAEIGADSCPLCSEYNDWDGCGNCPVAQFTGCNHCRRTPWVNADYYWRYEDLPFRQAAEAEYRFLLCLAFGDEEEAMSIAEKWGHL